MNINKYANKHTPGLLKLPKSRLATPATPSHSKWTHNNIIVEESDSNLSEALKYKINTPIISQKANSNKNKTISFRSASSFSKSVPDYFDGENDTPSKNTKEKLEEIEDETRKLEKTTNERIMSIIKSAKKNAREELSNYVKSTEFHK